MQRRLVAGRRPEALIALLTGVAFQVSGLAARADASEKPNVLIVMTDDQGLGDFSFTGNPVLETPNFDAFARHAIRLTVSGSYAFTLRRWPERAHVSLGEKYDESPSSPANTPDQKIIGFPMIAGARIEISGISVSATADPRATSATVTAQLAPGRTKLKAWFVDGAGHGLCGAFFVTAARKEDGTIATPQLRSH